MEQWTTTQLGKAFKILPRTIITFDERGFVSPSVQGATGRGSSRLWNYEDAVLVYLLGKLSPPIGGSILCEICRYLRSNYRLLHPRCPRVLIYRMDGEIWTVAPDGVVGAPCGLAALSVDLGALHSAVGLGLAVATQSPRGRRRRSIPS